MSEYVIIGLGLFGQSLAVELQSLGNEVVGVDVDRDAVQALADSIRQALQADATSEAVLRDLGVEHFDAAVVAIGHQEPSILTTLLLKKLGVKHVIAKAASDLHGEILTLVGADRVVYPEKETALRLAHSIAAPGVVDYLSISSDMGISRLPVPEGLVGMTQAEADLERRFHVRLLGVIRQDKVIFGGSVNERAEPGDVLIVAGHDRDLRAFSQFKR